MAQPNRGPRPILSNNVSETAAQTVLDGLDAGFTMDEIAPETGPKIRGEARFICTRKTHTGSKPSQ